MSESQENVGASGRLTIKGTEHVSFDKLSLNSPRSPLAWSNSANIRSDNASPGTPQRLCKRKCLSTTDAENIYMSTPKSSKDSGISSGKLNGPFLRARRSEETFSQSSTSTSFHSELHTPEKMSFENKTFAGVGEGLSSSAMSDLLCKPILDCGLPPLVEDDEGYGHQRSLFSDSENIDPQVEMAFKRPNPRDDECFTFKNKRAKSAVCENSGTYRDRGESSDNEEDQSEAENSFTVMKSRGPFLPKSGHKLSRSMSESGLCIKSAVERIDSDPTLIGDGTRSHVLPLLPDGQHKHSDLKEITPMTLVEVLEGKYEGKVDSFEVVDCRYPYEYVGGHIKSAINLYTKKQIFERYIKPKDSLALGNYKRGCNIIIFHCEFSSQRGPDMCRFLRSSDRNNNEYPSLHYPELYVLYGGYKAFFEQFQSYCEPQCYLPMVDVKFVEECRLFKSLSKTEVVNTKKSKAPPKIVRQTSMKKLCLD